MMEGDGIVDGVAKEPSRKMVVEWVVQVHESIPEEIGRNASLLMCVVCKMM